MRLRVDRRHRHALPWLLMHPSLRPSERELLLSKKLKSLRSVSIRESRRRHLTPKLPAL